MIYDSINKTCWWLQKNWFKSALFLKMSSLCHFVSFPDNYGGYENQLFKGNSQTVLFSIHDVFHMINIALSIEFKVCPFLYTQILTMYRLDFKS